MEINDIANQRTHSNNAVKMVIKESTYEPKLLLKVYPIHDFNYVFF